MANEPQSAVIRKSSGISPALCLALGGCLLGAGIAAGGFALAIDQKTALEKQSAMASLERERLVEALSNAQLTVPRLRLEELASLPLIPEYLAIVAEQPDSVDAQELKSYLQTVLDAASEETGLARIALEAADGTELLVAENPATSSATAENPRLEAAVPDFEDFNKTDGLLAGYLPESTMNVLLPQGTDGAEVTSSTSSAFAAHNAAVSEIPERTRLLAILAGLASAIVGLSGATLLRRQRTTHSR
ncbi:hypothetical protein [Roseibium sp. SCP14]|uniref:hypothetical protein n=1 Tax=Roseibium sp. SCP14 TaxID=3141375 RepID=UPI003334B76A